MRTHRLSMLAWAIGGGIAMWGEALALAAEMEDFPGGAEALAANVAAGAEAMRPMRWPAERLDTLGGYLTYHNVLLFNFFLAVYGAVVGAKAIRGAEERHTGEQLLTTGLRRRSLLIGRSCGFVLVASVVSCGLAVGTALGMAGGGEPDLAGSLVTCATTGLVALVGFGLGALLAQVAHDARTAAGTASLTLAVLYVATNVDGLVSGAGALAAVSPFSLANRSRALVPGHDLDPVATLALILVTVVLLALAAAAGERRDYGAPLWRGRERERPAEGRVPRVMVGSVGSAALRRGAVGLAVWALSSAALVAMMSALQPSIIDVWEDMGFLAAFGEGGAEASYWSFVASLLPTLVAAYVVTQSGGWVRDLQQRRVEMVRATGISWTRLVTGRVAALLAGCAALVTVMVGTMAATAGGVGSPLSWSGVVRLTVVAALFAWAMTSLAALVVAIVRSSAAVVVLGLILGVSYLLTYFVPLFDWPEWLARVSLFWAFATPYTQWPGPARLVLLVVVGVGGSVLAVLTAERSPAVP